jgi:RNA polymerase sigma factor (sigma-70 family)
MEEVVSTITQGARARELACLVKRFRGAVQRRARRLLRDDDAAADIVQEVFLRALQEREGTLQSHPRAWLYRVTRNLCLNHLRNTKRRGELSRHIFATNQDGRAYAQAPGAMLLGVLRRLPADLLVPVVYYYIDDLSHAEIALRLGVSRRTVGNRLVAIHTLLRNLEEPDC